MIPVEGDTAVASAYTRWNADPCDPDRANGVVNAIVALISRIRTERPSVKNIVVVGADDMLPMARLADTTRTGNEKSYADTFPSGDQYHGALASERVLSDDPYGDLDPVPWLNRRLYLPDLAVGRLVETPAADRRPGRRVPRQRRAPRRRPGVRVGLRLHDQRCRGGPRRADPLAHERQRRNSARADAR